MGSYAPDETVARVRALALQGYRPGTIERLTGVPDSTVHRWLSEWAKLGDEQASEIANTELRVARRLDEIFESYLERLSNGQEKASGLQIATMWGIARSKLHERAQRSQHTTVNVNNYVLVPSTFPQQPTHSPETPISTEPQTREEPHGIELSREPGDINGAG